MQTKTITRIRPGHLHISTSDRRAQSQNTQQRLRAAGVCWTAALGTAVFAACSPVTARPPFDPLPEALVDTLAAQPDMVIREVQTQVAEEGFGLDVYEVIDGYLETNWVTIVADENDTGELAPHERVVRFRFWADGVPGLRTKLTSEVVHRRTLDPSLPERLVEIMVPSDHNARKILERVLIAVREQFGSAGESVS